MYKSIYQNSPGLLDAVIVFVLDGIKGGGDGTGETAADGSEVELVDMAGAGDNVGNC